MYFRKNYDFSPSKEDFQIGEIDLAMKINDTLFGGAGGFNDSSNQVHLEFENEKEIDMLIKFLRMFKVEISLMKLSYFDKEPLLKNSHTWLKTLV